MIASLMDLIKAVVLFIVSAVWFVAAFFVQILVYAIFKLMTIDVKD